MQALAPLNSNIMSSVGQNMILNEYTTEQSNFEESGSHPYQYDITEYSDEGKFATAVIDTANTKLYVTFYDFEGLVSISKTNKNDEILIVYSNNSPEVYGMFINEQGVKTRSYTGQFRIMENDWSKPIKKFVVFNTVLSGNYIYITGKGENTVAENQVQNIFVVSTIDISENYTIKEYSELTYQSVSENPINEKYFKIISLDDGKAIILWSEQDSNQLYMRKIESGEYIGEATRINHQDNTFENLASYFTGSKIVGTNKFILAYDQSNDQVEKQFIYIAIYNYDNLLEPLCLKQLNISEISTDFNQIFAPDVVSYSERQGYIFTQVQHTETYLRRTYVFEINLETCQNTGSPVPISIVQEYRSINDDENQPLAKGILIKSEEQVALVSQMFDRDQSQNWSFRLQLSENDNCSTIQEDNYCSECNEGYKLNSQSKKCQVIYEEQEEIKVIDGIFLGLNQQTVYLPESPQQYITENDNNDWPEAEAEDYNRDIIQYSKDGKFAVITSDVSNDYGFNLGFYDFSGNLINRYYYSDRSYPDGDEAGYYGVCVTNTNKEDEVFVGFYDDSGSIYGAIINEDGEFQRGTEGFKIILQYGNTSEGDLASFFYYPQCRKSGNYIYVVAEYSNGTIQGYPIGGTSIDISGNGNIVSSYQKGFTIDGVHGNSDNNLKLISFGDGKALTAHVNQNDRLIHFNRLSEGVSDENSSTATLNTFNFIEAPQIWGKIYSIKAERIPSTEKFMVTYTDRISNKQIYVATYNYNNLDNPLCFQQIYVPQFKFGENFEVKYYGNIIPVTEEFGYLSYNLKNNLKNNNFVETYIIEINPSTCELLNDNYKPLIQGRLNAYGPAHVILNNYGNLSLASTIYTREDYHEQVALMPIKGWPNCIQLNSDRNECIKCTNGMEINSQGICVIKNDLNDGESTDGEQTEQPEQPETPQKPEQNQGTGILSAQILLSISFILLLIP